jgi:hypothetical protein
MSLFFLSKLLHLLGFFLQLNDDGIGFDFEFGIYNDDVDSGFTDLVATVPLDWLNC